MDQSYSESDVSLSPSKIFLRLQVLRQQQIQQREKLRKHRQYQDSPENSLSVTEIVSHFSNSTSYNTFRSLLQSSQEPNDQESCIDAEISTPKNVQDFIEGVSVLNLSQESEFITNSPISTKSLVSSQPTSCPVTDKSDNSVPNALNKISIAKKQISLEEMPILSPKKDFEELIIEKLKIDKSNKGQEPKIKEKPSKTKKPFLKRGEGMSRFGIQKNDLVIQNTKALPWRKQNKAIKQAVKNVENPVENSNKRNKEVNVQIVVTKPKESSPPHEMEPKKIITKPQLINEPNLEQIKHSCNQTTSPNLSEVNNNKPSCSSKDPINNKPMNIQGPSKVTHPLKAMRGQTWASVLTKEQDNFLRQLKQTEYYKNFISPAKSFVSDSSCNETLSVLRQDREAAEQKIFEVLENKVSHESFSMDNSFFNRFLKKNRLECSGESTPLVLQRCLYNNPDLMHLHPAGPNRKRNDNSCSDAETCSDYTECSESCASVSTCCSCKGNDTSHINESKSPHSKRNENLNCKPDDVMEGNKLKQNEMCLDDNAKSNDVNTAEMADMNAKLIATSELLKDRLRELEDQIETFKKENGNLGKMREELDLERQKFYEEKTSFEQKYNEEKILSEYYLAEEKEKLNKQKQVYDRYVREMRGKLSKKDKDEVINLKKEISALKEEIRDKDAKSTTITARLRNQLKIMEKEKKSLQEEVEKLKKENRRIQHSNDITRRLTNLKYLEQINKKLAHKASKEIHSEADLDRDVKYKAFEIERQGRSKKIQPLSETRRRAKSVPNLNVTSRYAKYFSQKDSVSDKDATKYMHIEAMVNSDNEDINVNVDIENQDLDGSYLSNDNISDEENNLEKMYNERFQSIPTTNRPSGNQEAASKISPRHYDGFFIQKSNSATSSKSLSKTSLSPYQANSSESSVNTSKSPVSILSHRSHRNSKSPLNLGKDTEGNNVININDNSYGNDRVKSPISILSNRSSTSQRSVAAFNKELYCDKRMIPSPEPTSSRSSVSKTKLNPTEIKKVDGSRELRFPNGNVKYMSADGKYSKFVYYNGDVKENFYDEGRIKYFYAETKTYHTTHPDGLEVLQFSDGQVEKRYKDGSSEIRLPNGSVRYYDPKNEHVREEWRFPDGAILTVSADGEQRIVFSNGQVEVHAKDRKYREFPDGTVKIVYNDGTSETRYASGRVRIKNANGDVILDKLGSS